MSSRKPLDEDHLKRLLLEIRDDRLRRNAAVVELRRLTERWMSATFRKQGIPHGEMESLGWVTMERVMKGARLYNGGSAIAWIKKVIFCTSMDHLRLMTRRQLEQTSGDDEEASSIDQGTPFVSDLTVWDPQAWDSWLGMGQEPMGLDMDRWSEGQRRWALEDCVETHLQEFEEADPPLGEALRKACIEEMSMREVAEHLGITKAAAEHRVSLGRQMVKRYLEDCLKFLEFRRPSDPAAMRPGNAS